MTRCRQRGFTLVELMVVLVVIGLLVSLVPAAFNLVLPGLELKSSVRELASVFRGARSQAIRDNRETVIGIDVQEKIYRAGGKTIAIPRGFELALFTAESETLSDSAGQIRFFPDGTSTGGRVTMKADEQTYYIVVDWLSGRVKIVD